MATPITRAHHPKALWPGVRRWWGIEYNRFEPVWSQIFESLTSEQAYEEDVEEVGFGLMSTMTETGGVYYDTAHQGATSRYTHAMYSLGYMVSLQELQDNQYEKLSFKRTSRLARSVHETRETIHANVFNRGFNSTYTGGDGVQLFSASHPTDSGNQSNVITTAADLSETTIEALVTQIGAAVDSRGMKFSNKPKQLLVSNSDWIEANRIVKSVLQNDTANNAVNVIKMLNVFPGGIIRNVYFTDADAWFITTDCMEGLTHYTRMEATFEKDNDFDTKNAKASVVMRESAGWSNWRQVYGSAGA